MSETIYSRGRDSALHQREKLLEEASRHELEAVVNTVMFAVESTITECGELALEPYQVELREALERALAARPELLRLKTLLSAGEKGVDAAQAGYLPVLSVFGSYGAEKLMFSSDFDDENHSWRAGVRGSWNIFDSFGTTGRVSQARARNNEVRLAYEQSRLDVTIEVRQAHSYYIESGELVNASGKVVEQAEESLSQATVRFNAGSGIQLDVLNAQVALTEARTNEVQALYEYAVAVARLKRAIGI